MSLLSRNRWLAGEYLIASAVALLSAPALYADQIAFVPFAHLTGEYDTNRLLADRASSGEWGEASLGAELERQTVRSILVVRPELSFQESSYKELNLFEAQMDMRGKYQTQETVYAAAASYHRQDSYNAEYGVAEFNPFNPDAPDTVGTGRVVTGLTRTTYNFSPDIIHNFTPRLTGEIDGNYTSVHYSNDIPQTYVSFSAPYVELVGLYALSERSQVGLGPYYSRFDPSNEIADGTLKSQSYGAVITYRYRTTQLTTSNISLKLGRVQQDQFVGPSTTSNTWGLEWTGTYQLQTSRLQYSVGRFLEPSSIGGEVSLDQIRLEYAKNFTVRLTAVAAVRITRQDTIGDDTGHRDRSFGDAFLRYALTRNWDLSGGYRFAFQRLPPDPRSIYNNGVYLTIGFHGLDPRR
jgi:hypothetical protein